MDFRVLGHEQAEQFLERGFVVVRDCFSREAAAAYTATIWQRLGADPDDPTTWRDDYVHMPSHRTIDVREFAPKAWHAICDLVGGEDRLAQPYPAGHRWNDGFIVNLGEGADSPWTPPSAASPGWHKDGDFFRHFLDSPEQGLLTLVLWSDVGHQGGATFLAADSIGPVARFLAARPEGVLPADLPYGDLIADCADFVEATGRLGDVYLIHPYVLHAKAQNTLRLPRFVTNPPVRLAEPLRFDRANPDDHSLVERAVLRGLGVARHEFVPAGPREQVVPERVRRQARLKTEELARLALG